MFKPIRTKVAGLFTSLILSAATVAVSIVAFSSEAHAWLRICNRTTELISVAYGSQTVSINSTSLRSQGWWNIQPNDCATVLSGSAATDDAFDSAFRLFYHAHSASGGLVWAGNNQFCVQHNVFDLTTNGTLCPSGFYREGFRQINSGNNANYTLNLNPPVVINF